MIDILDNEINIGDKVVFPMGFCERKELDYGLVENITKNDTGCWCKSFKHKEYPSVLRKSHQIIKLN